MSIETQASPATQTQVNTDAPNFGAGRYSDFMVTLHKQSQRLFNLSSEAAEKFARQAATDYGIAMKDQKVDAKVGKASGKDNKVTLSEAVKAKGIRATNALSLAHAIQWIGEAMKHGVSYGETKWAVNDTLKGYIVDLEEN
jgi:hypothetical protein